MITGLQLREALRLVQWTPAHLAAQANIRPTVLLDALATRDRCPLSKEDENRVREAFGSAGVIILDMVPSSLGVHKLPGPSGEEAAPKMPVPDSPLAMLDALARQVDRHVTELLEFPSCDGAPGSPSNPAPSKACSGPPRRPNTPLSRKPRGRLDQMSA